jgi:RNA polymerase sigma factor (sigma-70 family)
VQVPTKTAPTRDVRVEIRFKNNLILRAMKEAGIKTVKELADRSGVPYNSVCALIGMRASACGRCTGEWSRAAVDVATALRKEPEEIFSWFQRHRHLDRSVFTLGEVASEVALVSASTDPERQLFQHELRNKISGLLNRLNDKEKKIVQMRFGLEPYSREHTYDEISKVFGVTKTRIDMLTRRSLRRLRHPAIVKTLRPYIDVFAD